MKRCDYCGGRYADSVSICPADGHPTVDPHEQARSLVSGSSTALTAFNAGIVSPRSSAGFYRVFVQGSDLVFIRVENQSGKILGMLAPFLGPLGIFATLADWLFSGRGKKNYEARLQSGTPEQLLHDDEKNFRLHLAEIRQVVIEPKTLFSSGGTGTGQLSLSVRHNETLKLNFSSREDLDAAGTVLAAQIPSALRMEAQWNSAKGKY